MRRRGEVIQEVTCSAVQVTVQVGEKLVDGCYINSLPARLGSEIVLLTAVDRTIVTPDSISRIPCSRMTSPLFITEEKVVLAANPEIIIVDINLDSHDTPLFHALDLQLGESEDRVFDDLLYSKEEISSFSEFLHFRRIKAAFNLQLVGDYCANNRQCGSMNTDGGYDIDLDNIVDTPQLTPWFLLNNSLEKIQHIGGYVGFLVLIYFILSAIWLVIQVIRFRFKGYFWSSALEMAKGNRTVVEPRRSRENPRQEEEVLLVPVPAPAPALAPVPVPAPAPAWAPPPSYQQLPLFGNVPTASPAVALPPPEMSIYPGINQ
jgi:hypothetical protein